MSRGIFLLLLIFFVWHPKDAISAEWTKKDEDAFKESARVIEIFKLDLEFVQSLGRVMGRAPQYASRNAKQAEEKVLSDIAASYYDALKSYSNNTATFLTYLAESLNDQNLSGSFQPDSGLWHYPVPQEAEYCWLEGIADLAATGMAGAVAAGGMDDGLKMTAGAVAGANFVDFITNIPGVESKVQEQTLDVVETKEGEIEQIGIYAKKIHDRSVKYAISRLLTEQILVELSYQQNLVDQFENSAQKLSDLIGILNYGTNEAAYKAIQEMIREGKNTAELARELKGIATRLSIYTNHYKTLPSELILPGLKSQIEKLNKETQMLFEQVERSASVFEIILDTSKNVEIVQFYLSKS